MENDFLGEARDDMEVVIDVVREDLATVKTGRAKPIPIPGSEHLVECEVVVIAVGNDPNPTIPRTTPDLEVSRWGTIVTERKTGKTSKDRVYAGGDIATGAATVIAAMGAGKIAAKDIHKQIMGIKDEEIVESS